MLNTAWYISVFKKIFLKVLSMIAETAGTSIYECKQEAKVIEKKEVKIRETNVLLEVEPMLNNLRQERVMLDEFQRICCDIEYLTRIYISFKYLKQKEALARTEKNLENNVNAIESMKNKIKDNGEHIKCDEGAKEIQNKIDIESGGELGVLEEELAMKISEKAKSSNKMKAAQGTLKQEEKKLKFLTQNIKDDRDVLAKKEAQMEKVKF